VTPADMRHEALARVEESDRLFGVLARSPINRPDDDDGSTVSTQYLRYRVAHLRQTALVFAVLSREDS
jgi:hypothetical protein